MKFDEIFRKFSLLTFQGLQTLIPLVYGAIISNLYGSEKLGYFVIVLTTQTILTNTIRPNYLPYLLQNWGIKNTKEFKNVLMWENTSIVIIFTINFILTLIIYESYFLLFALTLHSIFWKNHIALTAIKIYQKEKHASLLLVIFYSFFYLYISKIDLEYNVFISILFMLEALFWLILIIKLKLIKVRFSTIQLISIKKIKNNNQKTKKMFNQIWPVNISYIVDIPINFLDRYVLLINFGPVLVAEYFILKKICSVFGQIYEPINQYLLTIRKNLTFEYRRVYFFIGIILTTFFLFAFTLSKSFIYEAFKMNEVFPFIFSIFLIIIFGLNASLAWIHIETYYFNRIKETIKYLVLSNLVYILMIFLTPIYLGYFGIITSISIQILIVYYFKYNLIRANV